MADLSSAVFEHLPDPVVVVDGEGVVRAVNARAERFFGHPRSEMVGGSVHRLIPGELVAGAVTPRETEAVRRGVGRVPVELHLSHLPGGDDAVIVAVLDVSERKRVEQELRLDRVAANVARMARSEFFIGITHALKTPLHAIIGFSDVLAGEALNERHGRFITHIHENGNRLLRLVEDLLDLARAESGHAPTRATSVHLGELVDRMLSLVADLAHRRHITIAVDVDAALPAIAADETRLKTAIYHVLDNMIGSVADGGKLEVNAARHGDTEVALTVRDPAGAQQSRLAQAALAPDGGGYSNSGCEGGVGMALAKRFVAMHGGRLHLDCNGRGNPVKATVILPVISSFATRERTGAAS